MKGEGACQRATRRERGERRKRGERLRERYMIIEEAEKETITSRTQTCTIAIIHGILLDINNSGVCSILCKECNASAIFVNNQCECNFNDNNNEGVECIQHLQRDIQTIDLNALSDELTNEERSPRSAFKLRRRLRIGDAEKVAQYFMNGGASAGHSHFTRESNAVCDNINSATNSPLGTVRQSDTEDEFHRPLPTSPLSGSSYKSYNSPLHMSPEAAPTISSPPYIPGTKTYTSTLGMARPTFGYSVNKLHPPGSVLDSIIQYGYKLPSHVLLRTSTLPSHILHNLAARRYSPYYLPMYHNPISKNSYPRQDNSPTIPFVGQPYRSNHDFNYQASNNLSTTGNNANESIQDNVASIPAAKMKALYPPMQYRRLISPYRYIPYHSPLPNALYFPFDKYIAPVVPPYFQRASDSTLTSVQKTQTPNSYCINNTNTERGDEMPTIVTDEATYSKDEQTEKAVDTTKHCTNVSEEQEKT